MTPSEHHSKPVIHQLTVGELRKQLDGVPDNTPIAYQRIEDVYFNEHCWEGVTMVFEKWGTHLSYSDYIVAWHACYHKDDKFFVIEAHY